MNLPAPLRICRVTLQLAVLLMLLAAVLGVYTINQADHLAIPLPWFTQLITDDATTSREYHKDICRRDWFFERASTLATSMKLGRNETEVLMPSPSTSPRQIQALTFRQRGRLGNQVRQLAAVILLAQCSSNAVVLVPNFMKPYLYWFNAAEALESNLQVYYSVQAIEKRLSADANTNDEGLKVVVRKIALYDKKPLKCANGRAFNRDNAQNNINTEYKLRMRRMTAALLGTIYAFPKPQLRHIVNHILCDKLHGRKYVGVHLRWKEGNCVQLCKSQIFNSPFTASNEQPRLDLLKDRNAHQEQGDCNNWSGTNDRVSSCEVPNQTPKLAWDQTLHYCAFCWMETSYVKNKLVDRGIDLNEYEIYIADDGELPVQTRALVNELGAVSVHDALSAAQESREQHGQMMQVSVDALMLALSDTMLFPPVSTFSVMIGRLRSALGIASSDTDATNFISIDV